MKEMGCLFSFKFEVAKKNRIFHDLLCVFNSKLF